jgi:hypothetical protein
MASNGDLQKMRKFAAFFDNAHNNLFKIFNFSHVRVSLVILMLSIASPRVNINIEKLKNNLKESVKRVIRKMRLAGFNL